MVSVIAMPPRINFLWIAFAFIPLFSTFGLDPDFPVAPGQEMTVATIEDPSLE